MLDNIILTCLVVVLWVSILAKISMFFDFADDMPNLLMMVFVWIAGVSFILLPVLLFIRIWSGK